MIVMNNVWGCLGLILFFACGMFFACGPGLFITPGYIQTGAVAPKDKDLSLSAGALVVGDDDGIVLAHTAAFRTDFYVTPRFSIPVEVINVSIALGLRSGIRYRVGRMGIVGAGLGGVFFLEAGNFGGVPVYDLEFGLGYRWGVLGWSSVLRSSAMVFPAVAVPLLTEHTFLWTLLSDFSVCFHLGGGAVYSGSNTAEWMGYGHVAVGIHVRFDGLAKEE